MTTHELTYAWFMRRCSREKVKGTWLFIACCQRRRIYGNLEKMNMNQQNNDIIIVKSIRY